MGPPGGNERTADRPWDNRTLKAFCDRVTELLAAEDEQEICRVAVDIGVDLLDLSAVTVYTFDGTAGVLRPTATSLIDGDVEPVTSKDDFIWQTFTERSSRLRERNTGNEEFANDQGEIHKYIAVSLDKSGVLLARVDGDLFSESRREIIKTLTKITSLALSQTKKERILRSQIEGLDHQTKLLEKNWRELEGFRQVVRSLIEANTRSEIETQTCERLVEYDGIKFGWIGAVDRSEERIIPRARAGVKSGYLDSLTIDTHSSDEPAVQALRSTEITIVDNVAAQLHAEQWRLCAFERGYRAVMAVPLSYEGVVSGVLTLYADSPRAFEGTAETVLSELGDLIGNAIAAIERQNALSTNRSTELEIEITDPACFFVRFVRQTGSSLLFKGMTPQVDGTTTVFLTADDPEAILDEADKTATIESSRSFKADNKDLIEIRLRDPFIGSKLAAHGIKLESASATPKEVRITVSIPPTISPRYALNAITTEYPGSSLLAKRARSRERTAKVECPRETLDRLTDDQREVLELAYSQGYFEQPKKATGAELADEMGLSTSGFHKHLRAAEAKVFTCLFDERD